jgi:hypothetical protein
MNDEFERIFDFLHTIRIMVPDACLNDLGDTEFALKNIRRELEQRSNQKIHS